MLYLNKGLRGNELTGTLDAALLRVLEAKALVTSKATDVTYAGLLEAQRFHVRPAKGFAAGRDTQSIAHAIHQPPAQKIQSLIQKLNAVRAMYRCERCQVTYQVSASAGFSIMSSNIGPGCVAICQVFLVALILFPSSARLYLCFRGKVNLKILKRFIFMTFNQKAPVKGKRILEKTLVSAGTGRFFPFFFKKKLILTLRFAGVNHGFWKIWY